MDDFERYGDYNDTDEDIPYKKSPVGLIIKILIAVVCFTVAGFLIFRVILFNYYPDKMKKLHFNETLTEYYNATGGEIDAKSQTLLARYDDEDEGNFFYDNFVFIEGANQVQLTLRYNTSLMNTIKDKYGVSLDPNSKDNFTYTLAKNPSGEVAEGEEIISEPIGTLSYVEYDKVLMYRYVKLVFDDVDLGLDEGETPINWLRLEVKINGVEKAETYKLAVYCNSEEYEYAKTESYKLSKKEKP